jgi:hypothetical protein
LCCIILLLLPLSIRLGSLKEHSPRDRLLLPKILFQETVSNAKPH